jgi:threonine dehydrogenase-like Zn-dependent dehydrogenase
MRALVLKDRLSFVAGYPDPSPGGGESLVRVRLAGICGTDLELIRGYMTYQGVPGHEFVGEVAASGDAALVGKRVAGEINAACGRCNACVDGDGRHCPNRSVLGILGRDGAFAEYLTLPNANLRILPDAIVDEAAVFIEPIAAVYEIFAQAALRRDWKIAVLGDGRLGALVAIVLKAEAYEPAVGGHHREKLERIAGRGIRAELEQDLKPGFDVVIDCTGNSAGLNRALALVRPRGTVILKSTAAAGASMNLAPVVINEITVVGSRCGRFESAIEALALNRIDPRWLIDGTYSLEEHAAALRAAANRSNFKILLKL